MNISLEFHDTLEKLGICPTGQVRKFNGCEENGFPSSLDIEITSACNGSCRMCFQRGIPRVNDAPVGIMKSSMDLMADAFDDVLFLGGEPMLYLERLIEMAKYAKEMGKKTYVTTNGSFLGDNEATCQLARFFDGINISIHSGDLKVNESITGVSLNKDELKRAVAILSGKSLRINCVLQKDGVKNLDGVDEILRLVKEINIKGIKFTELQLTSGVVEEMKGKFVSLDEIFGTDFIDFLMGDKCEAQYESDGINFSLKRSCLATYLFSRIQKPEVTSSRRSVYVLHADGSVGGWGENSGCHECHRLH